VIYPFSIYEHARYHKHALHATLLYINITNNALDLVLRSYCSNDGTLHDVPKRVSPRLNSGETAETQLACFDIRSQHWSCRYRRALKHQNSQNNHHKFINIDGVGPSQLLISMFVTNNWTKLASLGEFSVFLLDFALTPLILSL